MAGAGLALAAAIVSGATCVFGFGDENAVLGNEPSLAPVAGATSAEAEADN